MDGPGAVENAGPNMSDRNRDKLAFDRKDVMLSDTECANIDTKLVPDELVRILKLPTNVSAEQSNNMILLVECYQSLIRPDNSVRGRSGALVLLGQSNLLSLLPAQLVAGLVSEYSLFLTNISFPRPGVRAPGSHMQVVRYSVINYPHLTNISLLSDALSVAMALQYAGCGYAQTRSSDSEHSRLSMEYTESREAQSTVSAVCVDGMGSIVYNLEQVPVASWTPPSYVVSMIVDVTKDVLTDVCFIFSHGGKAIRKADEETAEQHKFCLSAQRQQDGVITLQINLLIVLKRYFVLHTAESASLLLPLANTLIETFALRPSLHTKLSQQCLLVLISMYPLLTPTDSSDISVLIKLILQQDLGADTVEIGVVDEEDAVLELDESDGQSDMPASNLNSTVHAILLLLQSESSRVAQPRFSSEHVFNAGKDGVCKGVLVNLLEMRDAPPLLRQLCLAYAACPVSQSKLHILAARTHARQTESCAAFVYSIFRNHAPTQLQPLFRVSTSKKEVMAAISGSLTPNALNKWSMYLNETVSQLSAVYGTPQYPLVQYLLPVQLQHSQMVCSKLTPFYTALNPVCTVILSTLFQCVALVINKVGTVRSDTSALALRQPRTLPTIESSSPKSSTNDESTLACDDVDDEAYVFSIEEMHQASIVTDAHEVLCLCHEDGSVPRYSKTTNVLYVDCSICHYWFHGPCIGFRSSRELKARGSAWCCTGCIARGRAAGMLQQLGISAQCNQQRTSSTQLELLMAFIMSIGDDAPARDSVATLLVMLHARQTANCDIQDIQKLDTLQTNLVKSVVDKRKIDIHALRMSLVGLGDAAALVLQQLALCSVHRPQTTLSSLWALAQSGTPQLGTRALTSASRQQQDQSVLQSQCHRVLASLIQALDMVSPAQSRSRLLRSVLPAFQTSAFLSAPRTTALLLELLADANATVRSQAVTVLGRAISDRFSADKSPQLLRLQCNMLQDTSVLVKKAAAHAVISFLDQQTWTYTDCIVDCTAQTLNGEKVCTDSISLRMCNPLLLPALVDLIRSIDVQEAAFSAIVLNGVWRLLFCFEDASPQVIHAFCSLFAVIKPEMVELLRLYLNKTSLSRTRQNVPWSREDCRSKQSRVVSSALKSSGTLADLDHQNRLFTSFLALPPTSAYLTLIHAKTCNIDASNALYVVGSISEASISTVLPHLSDLLSRISTTKPENAHFTALYNTIERVLPYTTHSHYKLRIEQGSLFETPLKLLTIAGHPHSSVLSICAVISTMIRVCVDRCDSVEHPTMLAHEICSNCRLQCTKILKLVVLLFSMCFQRCSQGCITDPRDVATVVHAAGTISALVQKVPLRTILAIATVDNYDKPPLQDMPPNSMHCPSLPIFSSPELALIAYFTSRNAQTLAYLSPNQTKTIPNSLFDGFQAFSQAQQGVSFKLYYNNGNHAAVKQVSLQLFTGLMRIIPASAIASASVGSYIVDVAGAKMVCVAPQALISHNDPSVSSTAETFHLDPQYDSLMNCDMVGMRVNEDSLHFEPGYETQRVLYSVSQIQHLLVHLDRDIVIVQALSVKSKQINPTGDSDDELLAQTCRVYTEQAPKHKKQNMDDDVCKVIEPSVEEALRATCLFQLPERINLVSRSFTQFELLPGYISPQLPFLLQQADYGNAHAVHRASQQLLCTLCGLSLCDSAEIIPLLVRACKDPVFSSPSQRSDTLQLIKKAAAPRIDRGLQLVFEARVDILLNNVKHCGLMHSFDTSLRFVSDKHASYYTEYSLDEALPGVYRVELATTRENVQGIKKHVLVKKKSDKEAVNRFSLPALLWGGAVDITNTVDASSISLVQKNEELYEQDAIEKAMRMNGVCAGYRVQRAQGGYERAKQRPVLPFLWHAMPTSIPARKQCLQQVQQACAQQHVFEDPVPVLLSVSIQRNSKNDGLQKPCSDFSFVIDNSNVVNTVGPQCARVLQTLSMLSELSKCPFTQYDLASLHALSVALVQQRLDRWIERAQTLCFRLGVCGGHLPPPAYDDLRLKQISRLEDVKTVILDVADAHSSVMDVQSKMHGTACALSALSLQHQFSKRLTGLYGLSTQSLSGGALPKTALNLAVEVNSTSQTCEIHDQPVVAMSQDMHSVLLCCVERQMVNGHWNGPSAPELPMLLACLNDIGVQWEETVENVSVGLFCIARQITTTYYRDLLALAVVCENKNIDVVSDISRILSERITNSVYTHHQELTLSIITAALSHPGLQEQATQSASVFNTTNTTLLSLIIQFISIEALLCAHLIPSMELLSTSLKHCQNELMDAELMIFSAPVKKTKAPAKRAAKRARTVVQIDSDDDDTSDFDE